MKDAIFKFVNLMDNFKSGVIHTLLYMSLQLHGLLFISLMYSQTDFGVAVSSNLSSEQLSRVSNLKIRRKTQW